MFRNYILYLIFYHICTVDFSHPRSKRRHTAHQAYNPDNEGLLSGNSHMTQKYYQIYMDCKYDEKNNYCTFY